jgi:hypothetical protein
MSLLKHLCCATPAGGHACSLAAPRPLWLHTPPLATEQRHPAWGPSAFASNCAAASPRRLARSVPASFGEIGHPRERRIEYPPPEKCGAACYASGLTIHGGEASPFRSLRRDGFATLRAESPPPTRCAMVLPSSFHVASILDLPHLLPRCGRVVVKSGVRAVGAMSPKRAGPERPDRRVETLAPTELLMRGRGTARLRTPVCACSVAREGESELRPRWPQRTTAPSPRATKRAHGVAKKKLATRGNGKTKASPSNKATSAAHPRGKKEVRSHPWANKKMQHSCRKKRVLRARGARKATQWKRSL